MADIYASSIFKNGERMPDRLPDELRSEVSVYLEDSADDAAALVVKQDNEAKVLIGRVDEASGKFIVEGAYQTRVLENGDKTTKYLNADELKGQGMNLEIALDDKGKPEDKTLLASAFTKNEPAVAEAEKPKFTPPAGAQGTLQTIGSALLKGLADATTPATPAPATPAPAAPTPANPSTPVSVDPLAPTPAAPAPKSILGFGQTIDALASIAMKSIPDVPEESKAPKEVAAALSTTFDSKVTVSKDAPKDGVPSFEINLGTTDKAIIQEKFDRMIAARKEAGLEEKDLKLTVSEDGRIFIDGSTFLTATKKAGKEDQYDLAVNQENLDKLTIENSVKAFQTAARAPSAIKPAAAPGVQPPAAQTGEEEEHEDDKKEGNWFSKNAMGLLGGLGTLLLGLMMGFDFFLVAAAALLVGSMLNMGDGKDSWMNTLIGGGKDKDEPEKGEGQKIQKGGPNAPEKAQAEGVKLTADRKVDDKEFAQLLEKSGKKDDKVLQEIKAGLGAGKVLLTPNAKEGSLGDIIYADKDKDGYLHNIQIAYADGKVHTLESNGYRIVGDNTQEVGKAILHSGKGPYAKEVKDLNSVQVDDAAAIVKPSMIPPAPPADPKKGAAPGK